jgi:hypothetical protein
MVSNGGLSDFCWISQDTNVGFCCLLCHHLLLSSAKKWPENSCALASNVQVGDNWSSTSSQFFWRPKIISVRWRALCLTRLFFVVLLGFFGSKWCGCSIIHVSYATASHNKYIYVCSGLLHGNFQIKKKNNKPGGRYARYCDTLLFLSYLRAAVPLDFNLTFITNLTHLIIKEKKRKNSWYFTR